MSYFQFNSVYFAKLWYCSTGGNFVPNKIRQNQGINFGIAYLGSVYLGIAYLHLRYGITSWGNSPPKYITNVQAQ